MNYLKNQKFRIIDLFCKAGGASYGMFWVDPLHIEITGVDIEPQPRYPFKFIQADFREVNLSSYDFIWASPPCQHYSRIVKKIYRQNHPELVTDCRTVLISVGKDYCIENVPGSPLNVSLKLRGEMFNLDYRKERWFETSFFILSPGQSRIKPLTWFTGKSKGGYKAKSIKSGLSWMNYNEYNNAVPPAYSYYILKSYIDQIYCNKLAEVKTNLNFASKVVKTQTVFLSEGFQC